MYGDLEFAAFLDGRCYANDEYAIDELDKKMVEYSGYATEQKKQRARTKLRNILNYVL